LGDDDELTRFSSFSGDQGIMNYLKMLKEEEEKSKNVKIKKPKVNIWGKLFS